MNEPLVKLVADNAVVLVVDLQDRLLPAIVEADACIAVAKKLIEGACVLGVPVLVTEQYPAGLGRTCATIREAMGEAEVFEKTIFSACVPSVLERLGELKRPQVIVCGIETHVCVQQSVLDLRREGYSTWVCADAVGSRRTMDRDTALGRMRQAAAVVTTVESVLFEMLGQAGGERFKQILRIVK